MRRNSTDDRSPEVAVTVRVTGPGTVVVGWTAPALRPAERECARVLLHGPDGAAPRYLGLVDSGDPTEIDLPDQLGPGECQVGVEVYSSGSWGGGRLTATGRSAHFRLP
jgi:hypothetical protein